MPGDAADDGPLVDTSGVDLLSTSCHSRERGITDPLGRTQKTWRIKGFEGVSDKHVAPRRRSTLKYRDTVCYKPQIIAVTEQLSLPIGHNLNNNRTQEFNQCMGQCLSQVRKKWMIRLFWAASCIYIYVLRPAEKKCVISSMIKFWIIESMHTTTAVIRAQTCLGPHVQRVLTHP